MLVSKRLVEVTVVVPEALRDRAVHALASYGYFHPRAADDDLPGEADVDARRLLRDIEERVFRSEEYARAVGVPVAALASAPADLSAGSWREAAEKALKSFKEVEEVYEPGVKFIREAEASVRDLDKKLEELMAVSGLDVDLGRLRELGLYQVVVGLMPVEKLGDLEAEVARYDGRVLAVVEESPGEAEALVALAMDPEVASSALSAARVAGFRPVAIPEELPKRPREAIEALKLMRDDILRRYEEVREKLVGSLPELAKRYSTLVSLREVFRCLASAKRVGSSVVMQGYVPSDTFDAFARSVSKATGDAALVLRGRVLRGYHEEAPSYVEIPRFLKPFHMITELYSTPRYGEIVPTVFIAVTFPLIFGLMFPDAGHALVLMLAGYIFYRSALASERRRDLGVLLMYVGAVSLVTGVLAGEFFGPLIGFSKLWKELGMEPPYSSPLHAVEEGGSAADLLLMSMFVALRVGVVMLAVGAILGFVNALRMGELTEALTVKLSKMVVFVVASLPFLAAGNLVEAGGILGRAAFGEPSGVIDNLVRYGIPLSLLYMLAAEPLVAAIREGAEGVKHALQSVFMEFFETVLMVIGNTASFLRIMGLSLAHSGIMFGFTVLAESVLTANPATILAAAAIYAFGNMLAIGLESIIVFAHTLRLHFYEWFSKFYVGGGVEYRPVRPAFLPALSTA